MRVTKQVVRVGGVAAGVAGVAVAAGERTSAGRAARRVARRGAREARYLAASAPGMRYRFAGMRPDPDVDDATLADRVRSTLGPVERRLDTPRVHVMVHDHVAVLHGEVPDERTADAIERAVLRVSGVDGVESHLHAGMIPSAERPSEGRAHPARSAVLHRFLDAAAGAGAPDPVAVSHAVLCAFVSTLPEDEREHVLVHLPEDARRLAGPARLRGERSFRPRSPDDLDRVAALAGVPLPLARDVVRAVLVVLHDQVPEEDRHVAAVLPAGLRDLGDSLAET